jgi:hypothetical protein
MGCYRIMCAMGIADGKGENGVAAMDNQPVYGKYGVCFAL